MTLHANATAAVAAAIATISGRAAVHGESCLAWNPLVIAKGRPLSCEDARAEVIDVTADTDLQGGSTADEKRNNVIRLAFGGNLERFEDFCRIIREEVPEGTRVVLRGSAITGCRWSDGAPFDADGPGTSDLDLTLVGDKAVALFKPTGFFVPAVHSRPVSDDDPEIAPELIPLREALMTLAGRPVNIQATRAVVMQFRGDLLGQPYLTLIEPSEPRSGGRSA